MTLIVKDCVKETSTTTGLGDITLAGAITGYDAFSDVCTSPADTCYVKMQAVNASGVPTGQWEIGLWTYSAANTLTRTTLLSSSTGSAVDFAAGDKQVFITNPANQVDTLTRFHKGKAYLAAAANTTNAGWQKVPIDTVSWDTGSIWNVANTRFIPIKAGYYILHGHVRAASAVIFQTAIAKNDTPEIAISPELVARQVSSGGGGGLVYANGTTDYFELYIYCTTASSALTNSAYETFFDIIGPF